MQFTTIDLVVNSVNVSYLPLDRGANGAFVYRKAGASIYAPRVVISTSVNDSANDKMTVQNNVPRTATSPDSVITQVGTDLVKTELRFLATTSEVDRIEQIDTQIALLQELRGVIETRNVIYA